MHFVSHFAAALNMFGDLLVHLHIKLYPIPKSKRNRGGVARPAEYLISIFKGPHRYFSFVVLCHFLKDSGGFFFFTSCKVVSAGLWKPLEKTEIGCK